GFPVCIGLCLDVRQRRRKRLLSGSALDRYHAPCALLCGWPLPHGHGRRGHVWHLLGNLLLVPQDDGTHDERIVRKGSFLAQLRRRVLYLHAIPLPGNGREYPPLLVVP